MLGSRHLSICHPMTRPALVMVSVAAQLVEGMMFRGLISHFLQRVDYDA